MPNRCRSGEYPRISPGLPVFDRPEEGGQTRIIFLDCGRCLFTFRTTLFAALWVSAVGLLAVFLLLILSRRIVRPIVESYEKKKRFITDAGHELKTPMTIIRQTPTLADGERRSNQWIDTSAARPSG